MGNERPRAVVVGLSLLALPELISLPLAALQLAGAVPTQAAGAIRAASIALLLFFWIFAMRGHGWSRYVLLVLPMLGFCRALQSLLAIHASFGALVPCIYAALPLTGAGLLFTQSASDWFGQRRARRGAQPA